MSQWLSFGAKTEHPGALRVDIRPVADEIQDIRRLTYPSSRFDGIECYHVLEHLRPDEAKIAVRELYRVLKPGGILLAATPDLTTCAQHILAGNLEILKNVFSPHPEEAQTHRWGYTQATLADLLSGAGFKNIRRLPSPVDPNEIRLEAYKL